MKERATMSSPVVSAVEVKHIAAVLLLVLLLFFVWMDVALYYKLQSQTDNLLVAQAYKSDILTKAKSHNSTSTTSKNHDLKSQSHGEEQQVLAFDPFNPISVKLLLLDHNNHYVYYPLGSWLDLDVLHISDRLTFITPDMISWSHVCVAAIAGTFLFPC